MYTWEITQKIAEAQSRHINDFSYIDNNGERIIVHIDDHKDICVDTDLL